MKENLEKINEVMSEVENKGKQILIFLLYFIGFLLGPSLFYSLVNVVYPIDDVMIANLVGNGLYAIMLFIILHRVLIGDFKKLGKDKVNNMKVMFKWWGIGLLIMMISNLIINGIVFNGSIAANEEANRELILASPFLSIFLAVFIAPFVEEITFRYGLRKIFKNVWFYAIFSGFIFGFLHAISGIESAKDMLDLLYIIPYGSLGFAFSVIYYKTENIWVNIFTHMLHNGLVYSLLILLV